MILRVRNVGWVQLGGPWVLLSHLWLAVGELGGSVSEGGLAAGWGHQGTRPLASHPAAGSPGLPHGQWQNFVKERESGRVGNLLRLGLRIGPLSPPHILFATASHKASHDSGKSWLYSHIAKGTDARRGLA